jgi:hypothetical protein
VYNDREVIVADLFPSMAKAELFLGMRVTLSNGMQGKVEGTFGKGGKCRVALSTSTESIKQLLPKTRSNDDSGIAVTLTFRKNVFSKHKGTLEQ